MEETVEEIVEEIKFEAGGVIEYRPQRRKRTTLCVTVDPQLKEIIDDLRGREKRSTFVEYLLLIGLKMHLWAMREAERDLKKEHGRIDLSRPR